MEGSMLQFFFAVTKLLVAALKIFTYPNEQTIYPNI